MNRLTSISPFIIGWFHKSDRFQNGTTFSQFHGWSDFRVSTVFVNVPVTPGALTIFFYILTRNWCIILGKSKVYLSERSSPTSDHRIIGFKSRLRHTQIFIQYCHISAESKCIMIHNGCIIKICSHPVFENVEMDC